MLIKKHHGPTHCACVGCGRMIELNPEDHGIFMFDSTNGLGVCAECVRMMYNAIAKDSRQEAADSRQEFADTLATTLEHTRPHLIKQYLDKYIIRQDRAKKILAVAVYNHYKRMKYGYDNPDGPVDIDKSNVIMLGPSGCGKTALVQHLSRLLDIPFAVTDSSSLTEAGYVGADVEIAVRNLYYASGQSVERTEHGIIYLDEFDKIARKSGENNSITADPGHEGVQQALLKMLEGNEVEFTERGMRKHPEAPTIKVNTQNILFIVGGAFVGIDKIIAERLQKTESNIGFGAKITSENDHKRFDELIHQVSPKDLMKYGILPEIVGRLPVICPLETLDEEALLEILTKPVNAPVRQYQELMELDNVELIFDEDALRAVAKKAIERKTGARSLKGIIEEVMLDIMFDIPKSQIPRRIIITKECITEGARPTVETIVEKLSA